MSVKLRELIRSVRACKTAAEERAAVAKECALIRTAFKEQAADSALRHRNVSKLLYIHMLGYPTHFGQMECIKLIASGRFPEKRIGYLGLMLLLDERQEVLMLVTNSLKNDLTHPNPYVVGLALCSLGNIASTEMARDLAGEVEKLLRSNNPYIRKKAALCAIRIVRKVPEVMEVFVPTIPTLLDEQHHGALLSAVTFIVEAIRLEPRLRHSFKRHVGQLVRALKSLALSGYAHDYEVSGITDPFLQVKLLQLLRLLGQGDRDLTEEMTDTLAHVATNTESTKNPGNAILYEVVQTIMSIDSEPALRVLAINILGRFLQNRENNIRYVALNTLCKVVHADTQAIQRHRNTIVDCLKDADISIRRRALDLIYALVNSSNIKALVRELLNYLVLASADAEFKSDLTEKICIVVERFAPSKRWQLDTLVRVLENAGNFTRTYVASDFVIVVSGDANLQAYAVHKLYQAMRRTLSHKPLLHVGLWCIGEYGDLLCSENGVDAANAGATAEGEDEFATRVKESEVLELIDSIMKLIDLAVETKQYLVAALGKLTGRFGNTDAIQRLLSAYSTSMTVDLQQRSLEYDALAQEVSSSVRQTVTARIPSLSEKILKQRQQARAAQRRRSRTGASLVFDQDDVDSSTLDDDEVDEEEDEEADDEQIAMPKIKSKKAQDDDPLSLDLLGGMVTTSAPSASASAAQSFDPLAGLFGGSASSPQKPSTSSSSMGDDLLSSIFSNPAPKPAAPAGGMNSMMGMSGTPNYMGNQFPAMGGMPMGGMSMGGMSMGSNNNNALDLLGMPSSTQPAASSNNMLDMFGAAPSASAGLSFQLINVFNKNGVSITFMPEKTSATSNSCVLRATFANASPNEVTNFEMKVAVPKFITLKLDPPSGNVLHANNGNQVTQVVTLTNSMHGQKPVMVKLKIDYNQGGQPVSDQAQPALPANL